MATSDTAICNLAISHLGIGKEIANLDTEKSEEASVCRRYYTEALDATLRDFHWPFATRVFTLGLVAEDPTVEWKYSYRYPSDVIEIRRIISGTNNEPRYARVPYQIRSDEVGRLVYSDCEDAQIEYTARVTNPALYPSDFTMAFSFRLAHYIVTRLAKGDPFKIKNDMINQYLLEVSRAKANALNEEQRAVLPESEFIQIREGLRHASKTHGVN